MQRSGEGRRECNCANLALGLLLGVRIDFYSNVLGRSAAHLRLWDIAHRIKNGVRCSTRNILRARREEEVGSMFHKVTTTMITYKVGMSILSVAMTRRNGGNAGLPVTGGNTSVPSNNGFLFGAVVGGGATAAGG